MDIAGLVQSYGYAAVAVGAFLEGETVLVLAGAAAARGHLSLPTVIAVATVASFLGDQFFFFVGRRWGRALVARFPALEPRLARVDRMIARWHTPLILSIRFLYGLRIAGPNAIGMSSVIWWRFLLPNSVGTMIRAPLVAGVGYGTGHALARVLESVDADELRFAALLFVVLALGWLFSRRVLARRSLRRRDQGALLRADWPRVARRLAAGAAAATGNTVACRRQVGSRDRAGGCNRRSGASVERTRVDDARTRARLMRDRLPLPLASRYHAAARS